MKRPFFWIVLIGSVAFLGTNSGVRAAEIVIIGGDQGLVWESGGGTIPATVIRSANTVERSNAPGGIIDFDPPAHANWIFPQRADSTVNIAFKMDSPERGGSIVSPNAKHIESQLPNIIDNNGTTALELRAASAGESARVLGMIIDFDLGARFGVNRIKFFPRNADPAFPAPDFPFQKDFIRAYEIFVNDGLRESQLEGVPILRTAALATQNDKSVTDIGIPPQYVRYLRLKSLTSTGFEIAEFQIFGTGFVPEAQYVSNIFDFGYLALLGKLRWIQEKVGDPGLSSAQIRTRTGTDPQPVEFNKVRPGEQIFRVGGGAGTGREGTSQTKIEVPWKFAQDVSDPQLKTLIENVLDNEEVDYREALLVYNELPSEQREAITLEEADYKKLKSTDKGTIRHDVINWSAWSPPYPLEGIVAEDQLQDPDLGVAVVSPGPRRYFQFMIEFSSADFDAATGVGGLALDVATPPFAEELVAEISPRTTALAERTRFLYAVLNKSSSGRDVGFGSFEISTPLRVESIGKVEISRPDGTVQEADFSSAALTDLPVLRGDFTIDEVRDDGFIISFPYIEEDGAVLKVEFENAVLRFGTTFVGRARNLAENATIAQEVVAGNAADLRPLGFEDPDVQPVGTPSSGNLSVTVPIVRNLLIGARAEPPVFSPNGDGVNDQGFIKYDITNIARPSRVRIRIYDLAGRQVRELYDDADSSGRFARPWNGRDDSGELVPPGHYIFTISLEAGTGKEKELGMVDVVY